MLHSIDTQGRILEVSDLWLARLGYLRDEVLGRPSTDFLTEASARYARDVVLPAFFETGACEVEYDMRHRDGTPLPVRLRAVAVRGPDGAVERSIAVVEDLTERRALERKMLDAQKLESLARMAGTIAHDFGNLLASVIGNAQLAQRHVAHVPAAALSLEQITTAAWRAADLCRQLLAYSGRGPVEIEEVDLDELVAEMVDVLAVNVDKRAAIELSLLGNGARVAVDAAQIRQIILNLALNASEALAGGRGAIRIATGVAELPGPGAPRELPGDLAPGSYVCLRVSDTGCGMAPDVLARIFDPFFTTKASGRGLGLAAVHGIVRGHRGAIDVASTLGDGTAFHVYLPALAPTGRPRAAGRSVEREVHA